MRELVVQKRQQIDLEKWERRALFEKVQCCGGDMIKWLKRIFCLVHRWDWKTDTCMRCGKKYDYRD